MKFSTIFTLGMAAGLTVAAPALEARQDATTLASKIVAIGKAVNDLNNTVSTLKPKDPVGFVKALQVYQQSAAIETAIKNGISSANKTPQLNDDDSFTVAAAVLDLINPIQTTLNNIIVKKPAFATAIFSFGDLSKTVLASVKSQKSLTQQFGDALVPKLSADYQSLAPGVLDTILGYFDTAIDAYQKCTGLVCLPAIPSPSKFTLPKPGQKKKTQ